jgi:TolA-binding protein
LDITKKQELQIELDNINKKIEELYLLCIIDESIVDRQREIYKLLNQIKNEK